MTRILYLGDRPLGLRCLEFLVTKNRQICGVVSRSDSNNNWWGRSAFEGFCKTHRLPWFDFESPLRPIVKKSGPDIMISVLFTKIVPNNILEKIRGFNLHCAPLPEYKGFNSTLWAIINEEKYFGATLHEMAEKPDTGNIVSGGRFKIPKNVSNIELYRMTHENGYNIFCENIESIVSGKYESTPQNREGRYYKRWELPLRELDLNWSKEKIHKYARAFFFPPFEPAYFLINGQKVRLIPETK